MKTAKNQNTQTNPDIQALREELKSLQKEWAEYKALSDDLKSLQQQLTQVRQ